MVKPGLPGHPEVAVFVVRRHAALIAPEDVPPVPRNSFGVGWRSQNLVETARGGAAGQGDGESALVTQTLFGQATNFAFAWAVSSVERKMCSSTIVISMTTANSLPAMPVLG